jgi:hypothetical protein
VVFVTSSPMSAKTSLGSTHRHQLGTHGNTARFPNLARCREFFSNSQALGNFCNSAVIQGDPATHGHAIPPRYKKVVGGLRGVAPPEKVNLQCFICVSPARPSSSTSATAAGRCACHPWNHRTVFRLIADLIALSGGPRNEHLWAKVERFARPHQTPYAHSQPVHVFTRELHTSVRCDVRLAWCKPKGAHTRLAALPHGVQSRSSFSLLAQCPIATLTTSAARHPDKLVPTHPFM